MVGGVVVLVTLLGRHRSQIAEHAARHDVIAREAERDIVSSKNRADALAKSLDNYRAENKLLKEAVAAQVVQQRRSRLDRDAQAVLIANASIRAEQLASEYLKQTEQWVSRSITSNNYAANKKRLVEAIEWCREIGFAVSAEEERRLLEQLKRDFEEEVKKQIEREEQARIKAQIREEQAREREVQKEMERLEREKFAIAAALEKAMAEARDQHSVEVENLKARLLEAESKQRAVSQAQLTKAGHIYVISNLGAFGEGVFKIGMTRRLDPTDRITELGDASVPFPFDVHMMISCPDAPRLEAEIHKQFHKHRVNRVNPRKEYFRVDFEALRAFVEKRHGEVQFTAEHAAAEYRQSLTMSEEDQAYIEAVFESAEKQLGVPPAED